MRSFLLSVPLALLCSCSLLVDNAEGFMLFYNRTKAYQVLGRNAANISEAMQFTESINDTSALISQSSHLNATSHNHTSRELIGAFDYIKFGVDIIATGLKAFNLIQQKFPERAVDQDAMCKITISSRGYDEVTTEHNRCVSQTCNQFGACYCSKEEKSYTSAFVAKSETWINMYSGARPYFKTEASFPDNEGDQFIWGNAEGEIKANGFSSIEFRIPDTNCFNWYAISCGRKVLDDFSSKGDFVLGAQWWAWLAGAKQPGKGYESWHNCGPDSRGKKIGGSAGGQMTKFLHDAFFCNENDMDCMWKNINSFRY